MKILIQKIGENNPCFEGEVFAWEFDAANFTFVEKDGAEPQTFSRDEYGGKGVA